MIKNVANKFINVCNEILETLWMRKIPELTQYGRLDTTQGVRIGDKETQSSKSGARDEALIKRFEEEISKR